MFLTIVFDKYHFVMQIYSLLSYYRKNVPFWTVSFLCPILLSFCLHRNTYTWLYIGIVQWLKYYVYHIIKYIIKLIISKLNNKWYKIPKLKENGQSLPNDSMTIMVINSDSIFLPCFPYTEYDIPIIPYTDKGFDFFSFITISGIRILPIYINIFN